MKQKRVWRFICEYCGKTGYSRQSMAKHERHCTLNDDRECRVCKIIETEQNPMHLLVAAALRGGLKELRAISEGCPACMLAAIRRIPIHYPGGYPDDLNDEMSKWSFKEAMKKVWADFNKRESYG